MSDPTPPFPAALEWEQQPQPSVWVIPTRRQRWWLYGLFFVLTMFSTTVVGARMQFNFLHQQPVFSLNDDSLSLFPIGWIARDTAHLLLGLPFSLTLVFVLFAREMGPYLYAPPLPRACDAAIVRALSLSQPVWHAWGFH